MSRKPTSRKLPPLLEPSNPSTSSISTPAIANASAARWQAVVGRDTSATDFVYAVITTKIYCRPSCSARLARRANVEFYDTPAQAERAGFRACKRCKPESLRPAVHPQLVSVQRACRTIREDIGAGRKPTLGKIAGEAGLTPSHFHRVFKKIMGVTPGKYAEGFLAERSKAASGIDGDGVDGVQWDVRGEGGLSEGIGGYGNENINPVVFQLWDDKVCSDLDAWLMGGNWGDPAGAIGADDNSLLWNDFDDLIAAEAQLGSGESSGCPLTGNNSSCNSLGPEVLHGGRTSSSAGR